MEKYAGWDLVLVGLAGCGVVKRENKNKTSDNLLSMPLTCLLLDVFHYVFLGTDPLLLSILCHAGLYMNMNALFLAFSFIPHAPFEPLSGSSTVIVQT